MDKFVEWLVICLFTVVVLSGVVLSARFVANKMPIWTTQEYQKAIEQCEAVYDQKCEIVITARVKGVE